MQHDTSPSEDHGIAALTDNDLQILSVGVSTGGMAEMRMARANPRRSIIATTVDASGIEEAKKQIADAGLDGQIELKLEDIRKPLPYTENYFDFIYARLVLHYLTKQELHQALQELCRVLKPKGRLYIVVRSLACDNAKLPDNMYDPETGMTSGSYVSAETGELYSFRRFFHSEETIRDHVLNAGFRIQYVTSYDEKLFVDFMHTKKTSKSDNVIELLAQK